LPEERSYKKYESIKLPTDKCSEEYRGFEQCCCSRMLVLASSTSSDSWKNDKSSAWVKLANVLDTVSFTLTKDGQPTTYPLTTNDFVQQPFAKYTTIDWQTVLSMDGIGCYELNVDWGIYGITGSYVWGKYNLKEFTIESALRTARLRTFFNLYHSIEQIDFTGTNVEDTIRFNGFIGKRQPNMEIDNLIYQNRELKTVVRENLNSYEIKTNPSCDCLINKLTDLHLLSENELFISDYNAHNHSYQYNDVPVIVEESPEIDYLDKYQRKAVLTCIVGDRLKDERAYYKGIRKG